MVRMSEGRRVKSCFGIAQIEKVKKKQSKFSRVFETFYFNNILETLVKSGKIDITFLPKP